MKNNDDILKYLREKGENLEIPKALEPEQMRKRLKQQLAQSSAKKQKRRFANQKGMAIAASICLVLLGGFGIALWQNQPNNELPTELAAEKEQIQEETVLLETAELGIEYPKIRYEDIYASMSSTWEKMNYVSRGETPAGEMNEAGAEIAVEESAPVADLAAKQEMSINAAASDDYGKTNVQTIGVDEGDIVKNDGRYLYQKIRVKDNGHRS